MISPTSIMPVQVPVNASFSNQRPNPDRRRRSRHCRPVRTLHAKRLLRGLDINDDVLKKFRTATGAGKLSFADAGGHGVSVPQSFNGFNQAFDALLKE